MSELTQERLKELLRYDPDSGSFEWKMKPGQSVSVGQQAGSLMSKGYIRIRILGKKYLAHRLAWLYMTGEWPKNYIDHIDGNKSNNKWSNLREATNSQNKQNMRSARIDNKVGYLGVSKNKNRFRARINVNGEVRTIGYFDTAEEAHEAYLGAKRVDHLFNTL